MRKVAREGVWRNDRRNNHTEETKAGKLYSQLWIGSSGIELAERSPGMVLPIHTALGNGPL